MDSIKNIKEKVSKEELFVASAAIIVSVVAALI